MKLVDIWPELCILSLSDSVGEIRQVAADQALCSALRREQSSQLVDQVTRGEVSIVRCVARITRRQVMLHVRFYHARSAGLWMTPGRACRGAIGAPAVGGVERLAQRFLVQGQQRPHQGRDVDGSGHAKRVN
jgi:hypothetical protein